MVIRHTEARADTHTHTNENIAAGAAQLYRVVVDGLSRLCCNLSLQALDVLGPAVGSNELWWLACV